MILWDGKSVVQLADRSSETKSFQLASLCLMFGRLVGPGASTGMAHLHPMWSLILQEASSNFFTWWSQGSNIARPNVQVLVKPLLSSCLLVSNWRKLGKAQIEGVEKL